LQGKNHATVSEGQFIVSPAQNDAQPAVILLSGGLDSSTLLALARANGHRLFALSFAYGQRHELELHYARVQAKSAGVEVHEVIDLFDFGRLVARSSSLLAASSQSVDKSMGPIGTNIPATYVPARNTLFLAYALGWAEVLGARSIYVGVNAVDYSGYPDCRPIFIDAFERMANLATKAGVSGEKVTVHTPLIGLSKAEIIALGLQHGVDYAQTLSCYDPQHDPGDVKKMPRPCGACESCRLRADGFSRLNVRDPALLT
jgi:7-cyano-7-deazaguanine synthase